ncbi:hypothetical protein DMUE_1972 [Dictyocoela muelleri]|nr:hypothetical protein DMUE_1972 [Dictyocoela muelleri]
MDVFEHRLYTCTNSEMLDYLLRNRIIAREVRFKHCKEAMKLKKTKKALLEYTWRCANYHCNHYQSKKSVLKIIFFIKFKSQVTVLKVIYNFFEPIDIYKMIKRKLRSKNMLINI